MKTRLILIVGTNPLPVWVAWEHLKGNHIGDVLLIYTENTQSEFARLKERIEQYQLPVLPCKTSPGDLSNIRRDVINQLQGMPDHITSVHVHFTGGTKAMAVATVDTVAAWCREGSPKFIMSYLDPREGNHPRIISGSGDTLIPDTRRDIAPSLKEVALLNGFQIGPFVDHSSVIREHRPKSQNPTDKQRKAARIWMQEMCKPGAMQAIREDIARWNGEFRSRDRNGQFTLPKRDGTFTFDMGKPYMEAAGADIEAACGVRPQDGAIHHSGVDATQEERDALQHFDAFIRGDWIEYATFDALDNTLQALAESNPIRSNFDVSQNVFVRRANKGNNAKPFELDVVALLGYQVVVVSCTGDLREGEIKQKGIEALHRARQLGGEEARAIVVNPLCKDRAKAIRDELFDAIGSDALPLNIWGTNTWQHLERNFEQHLAQLGWQ